MNPTEAIAELEHRLHHLKRNLNSPGTKIMARGVLTSATRLAQLMGVQSEVVDLTIDPLEPLLDELSELRQELNTPIPPVVMGNRGFRSFWTGKRKSGGGA